MLRRHSKSGRSVFLDSVVAMCREASLGEKKLPRDLLTEIRPSQRLYQQPVDATLCPACGLEKYAQTPSTSSSSFTRRLASANVTNIVLLNIPSIWGGGVIDMLCRCDTAKLCGDQLLLPT